MILSAKKTGEMKEEIESAAALVHQYVPPSPDKIQVVMNAGTASVAQAGPGAVALKFPGYVKPGDSLSKIAKRKYGNANLWKTIYEANQERIKNPDLIQVGWELRIPAKPE